MPLRASASARISGVAMGSVHLYSDRVALHEHLVGLDRDIGRKVQRLAGAKVEDVAVAGALDDAPLAVDGPLEEDPAVMAAAVLDREDLAIAVDDADLEVLPGHDLGRAGGKLGDG